MKTMTRDEVKQVTAHNGAKIVEVLDEKHFDEFHLPGAINVPLDDEFDERIQAVVPNKHEKVIVYCQDSDCPASSKAANRMEELGYEHVFDYERGKMDWKKAGLPVEN